MLHASRAVLVWSAALLAALAATALAASPHQPHKPIPKDELAKWAEKLYDGARPKEYTAERLGHVALPLGGIGTGSIAINGQGRLVQWQVFNNFNKAAQVNDTFFAVWARPAGGEPVARVLQTADYNGLPRVEELVLIGEYPLAWLHYRDPKLPVEVSLEAFNPMIPLNPRDSAIPCAVFTFTVKNPTDKACDVSLLATLQNAVGYAGHGGYRGTDYGGFIRNRNQPKRVDGLTTLSLGAEAGQPAAFAKPVRLFTHALGRHDALPAKLAVGRPGHRWRMPLSADLAKGYDVLWLDAAHGHGFGNDQINTIAQAVEQGVVLLATGLRHSLAALYASAPHPERPAGPPPKGKRPLIVFEDFESGTYTNWTVEGKAFAKGPVTGTLPAQQPVSGFRGKYLVNTYVERDGPQGTATSKPFTIERRYVNFLVGGGAHAGQTCMNLLVEGKVVRTACGKNLELLEPACWDAGTWMGKTAQLQIVDKHSGGWGHINIDHILFSDKPDAIPPPPLTPALREMMPFTCDGPLPDGRPFDLQLDGALPSIADTAGASVRIGPYLRFENFKLKEGARVVLKAPNGDPLLIEGPHKKGKVLVFTAAVPRGLSWTPSAAFGYSLVAYAAGTTFTPATGLDPAHRYWGTMALATTADKPTAMAQWHDPAKLWADFAADGRLAATEGDAPSGPGATWNAALAAPLRIGPGQEAKATFLLTWHFPNHYYVSNPAVRIGNMYSNWFKNADQVAAYLARNLPRLRAETMAYHDAIYDTTLPYYVVDAFTSQADVIRSQTCMWSEAGHFLGFEGNACCPMNCTHVWNYAQTMAKLFPSLERNVRQLDLGPCMNDAGLVGHRHAVPPTRAAAGEATDGQCGTVLKAYREYLQCPDDAWLTQWYPRVKKAMLFLIEKDKRAQPDAKLDDWVPVANRPLLEQIVRATEPDGILVEQQWNTYDCHVHGPNPFVGSLYLAALRAAEEMAKARGDDAFAAECHAIFERGRKNFDDLMWQPEFGYYIQTYDEKRITAQQFGWGCHCDQTMGQWWADVLGLGPILPRERVHSALRNIFRHNWRTNFRGHKQLPRVYALPSDKGLLICTWPHGRRPPRVTNYSDEIWTGIEYEVAAELIYQGFVKEGLMVVLGCRDRYDGVSRPGTNYHVGNPFDEVECGTNYARAMSSWSVLLALTGATHHGPRGILGFKPRYQPHGIRAFFTAAEGWGVFEQKRQARQQTDTLDIRYGHLSLSELVFELPEGVKPKAALTIGGRPVAAALEQDGAEARLVLPRRTRVAKGQTLRVGFTW